MTPVSLDITECEAAVRDSLEADDAAAKLRAAIDNLATASSGISV